MKRPEQVSKRQSGVLVDILNSWPLVWLSMESTVGNSEET